jgi:hypothetical protein
MSSLTGAKPVRAAARAGRFGLLLALLLVILEVGATAGLRASDEHGAQQQESGIVASASSSPSLHDELQDWLRLSIVARNALATALPDSWWAVCPHEIDGYALHERLLVGTTDRAEVATASVALQPSRAPPVRVI